MHHTLARIELFATSLARLSNARIETPMRADLRARWHHFHTQAFSISVFTAS